ncbi:MAG: D-alanine--D-alanine ligase [Deltaproteobacteria bacterium]|nr:D-alanine--D-alanine ligase [Deltaproteobacteria bacterium]MBW2547749.1 D-alanine--D-alanine ligase [Deltaproteobacteria bacterium]MBW2718976.1 D-alanine--D-alanine ligase [Deltaproteobacteria bacterium]RLB49449.1 MAG: D-alanine--D-alanine ligase [Deltaproteobacteria bacterium]
MKDKEIGILLGGVSAERDISLKTGEAMFQALKARGYRVQKVFVDADIDRVLRQTTLDVAVIALHGTYGEDGCIQGTLETMGIPYTGSGVLPSALAMDKLKSKELFRLYNVPTPSYYVVRSSDLDRLEQIHSSFGFPSFVKPRSGGSSVGAGGAKNLAELKQRCEDAARFDEWVLVERLIRGREVAVGLLDGNALGAIEIEPKGGFYDYKSKYQAGQSEYHFPARLSPTRYQGVLNLAERSVQAVGATGATRVDLLVTSDENEYVLEVNTLPGMTPTSLLPKIAAGAGYDFGDLCEAILERAALHVGEGLPSVSEAERAALTADRLPLGPAE